MNTEKVSPAPAGIGLDTDPSNHTLKSFPRTRGDRPVNVEYSFYHP